MARTTVDLDYVFLHEDAVLAIYLGDQLVWAGSSDEMLFVPDEFEEG